MNSSSPADHAELIEQLSAYLDGELDADSRQQVEQLLLANEHAREALRQLEQASGLLDDLPRSDVEPSFTETTVSMVALAEAAALEQVELPQKQHWGLWMLRGGGMLLAVIVGFAAIAAIRPRPNDALLRDLPVIENLDAYRHAGSAEFLRQLKTHHLFTESEAGDSSPTTETTLADTSSDRRARIERLDDGDRERLLDSFTRYEKLNAAERQRLRDLDMALSAAPDGFELRQIVNRYHAWLDNLPAVQRAELLATNEKQRIERIEQLRAGERRRKQSELAAADLKVMADWLEQMFRKLPQGERQRAMMRLAGARGSPFEQGRGPALADLNQVRERLSPAAQAKLMAAPTPQEKQELIGSWMRQALSILASRYAPRIGQEVSEERLRQFFDNEISESDRERLLTLPAEEMKMQLRRMYQISVMGGILPRGEGALGPRNPLGQSPLRGGNRPSKNPRPEMP